MKYIISIILSISIITQIYANSCSYQSEINQCVQANKDNWARNIDTFVCMETKNTEEIAYQVIFDFKFKEIDKDAENFLQSLQNSPNYYFWSTRKETYIDWINYINDSLGKYWTLWRKYDKLCSPIYDESIIQAYLSCTNEKQTQVYSASKYFQKSTCMDLAEYKLSIFRKVAYDLLQVNKLKVLKDFRKKQIEITRTRYDSIVQDMYNNLDYIIRINNQRNKVTKSCQTISWG